MTTFISEIASKHFTQQPTTSLLRECFKRLESGDWSTVLDAIRSQCQPVQDAAAQTLKRKLRHPSTRDSFRSLVIGTTPAPALLHTLAEIEPLLWCDLESVQRVEQWLLDLLRCPDSDAASSAAILLLRRFPAATPMLTRHIDRGCIPELARRLCLEGNESTIWSLIRFYGINEHATKPIPSSLGLALTPNWIAQNQPESSGLVAKLAAACGYVDSHHERFPIDHFQAGLWFVNQSLCKLPAGDVRQRVNELMWAILRETPLQMLRASDNSMNDVHPFDPFSNIGKGLLLAAVRELDHSNVQQRRTELRTGMTDPLAGAAICLHSSAEYSTRVFIDEPLDLATQLGVPAVHRGEFLLSHAALTLEPDNDKRIEAELLFRARWKLMQIDSVWESDGYTWGYTDSGTPRFPAASRIVRRKFNRQTNIDAAFKFVSPCTRAVHCALDSFSIDIDPEILSTKESKVAPFLTPLGVEIQIPNVADEFHFGWKETFRSFGIPSPRRPECRRMLEAALPPAASYHAPVEFLKSLPEIGVINAPQDVGVHISLQGDLEANARYLAFPQLFLNQPIESSPRARSGLRLVMSKGLVAINKDVVQCRWASNASCRTEIRVFVAGVQKLGEALKVNEAISLAIKTTHLLGSAFLSPIHELKEIANEFAKSIEAFVQKLPLPFQQLLHANFYEATGDPSAASLLDYLPIIKLRESVRPYMTDHDFREDLQNSLETIRTKAADKVREAIVQLAD